MINWICKNCRKDRQHKIKLTNQEKYKNYKILICQHCGEKEMVPDHVIKQQNDFELNENAGTMKVNWEAIKD